MLPLPLPSGQRIYIKSEYTHKITEFLHNHCPNTMLESDGKSLHEEIGSSLITKFVSSLSLYACTVVEEPSRSFIIDGIISSFEGSEAAESPQQLKEALWEIVLKVVLPVIKGTLPENMSNLIIDGRIDYVLDVMVPYWSKESYTATYKYLSEQYCKEIVSEFD